MSDKNKEVVRRWVALANSDDCDPGKLAEVFAPKCVIRPGGGLPEVRGVEALSMLLKAFRVALPDLEVTTEELVAEGDRVAARFTTRGTQAGPLMHLPASGRRVAFGGFATFRIEQGRIVEEWLLDDLMSLTTQVSQAAAVA